MAPPVNATPVITHQLQTADPLAVLIVADEPFSGGAKTIGLAAEVPAQLNALVIVVVPLRSTLTGAVIDIEFAVKLPFEINVGAPPPVLAIDIL